MTSLTRELNNSQSQLYRWFESKQSDCDDLLIDDHNLQMDKSRIIRPSGHIEDFGLLGTAFVYAFRWHLGLLGCNFNQTVASYNLNSTVANQLLEAKTVEEQAIACLMFAAYEQKYRSGSVHEIATVLMDYNKKRLKPELSYISAMIDDLANLIESIPSIWNAANSSLAKLESGIWDFTKLSTASITSSFSKKDADRLAQKSEASRTKYKCFLNPDFSGSYYVKADAQQIIDGMLIKCFTTLKKYPLSRQHFWQQLAYVLMDWDNKYKITSVCWYYSRQKALFVYPIKSLFTDLNQSRAEFKDFLLSQY